jgi:hypothetical protein
MQRLVRTFWKRQLDNYQSLKFNSMKLLRVGEDKEQQELLNIGSGNIK